MYIRLQRNEENKIPRNPLRNLPRKEPTKI